MGVFQSQGYEAGGEGMYSVSCRPGGIGGGGSLNCSYVVERCSDAPHSHPFFCVSSLGRGPVNKRHFPVVVHHMQPPPPPPTQFTSVRWFGCM